jgi:hypothetical protein
MPLLCIAERGAGQCQSTTSELRLCCLDCCISGQKTPACLCSMPATAASGAEASPAHSPAAATAAADESAARHGGLDKQAAAPAALSPAQPHNPEGRQHPRQSIDMEPTQVCCLSASAKCSRSRKQTSYGAI